MNVTKHPDDKTLHAYLQEPEAGKFTDVSLHLAQCSNCRKHIHQLEKFKAVYPSIEQTAVNEDQQQYVDQLLYHSPDDEALKQEIRNNPAMLKSALYGLTTHLQQSEKPVGTKQPEDTSPESLLSKFSNWISAPAPVWAGLATAAIVSIVATTLLVNNPAIDIPQADSTTLVSYQDDRNMRFFPKQTVPGIGFFNQANHYSKAFSDVEITLNDDGQVNLQWQTIEDATEYQLELYRFEQGAKTLEGKLATTEPHAAFNLQLESFNQRFEWTLTGRTAKQEAFIVSGGFIIQR